MRERDSYKTLISTTEIIFDLASLFIVASQLLTEYQKNMHWNPYSLQRVLVLWYCNLLHYLKLQLGLFWTTMITSFFSMSSLFNLQSLK